MSPRLRSRLAASALAVAALALFALTFAPWFAHEGLNGPRERFLRASDSLLLTLSGWELGNDLAALVLLAVFTGLGAAVWCARRPRDPLVPAACGLAVAAAATAAWRIGREIRAPSVDIYTDVQLGVRVALAAAIALAVVALMAAAQSLIARPHRQGRSATPWPSIWPAVAGATALYLLAIGVNATEVYQPQALVLFCAGAPLGYAVPRWWVALLPFPVAVALFKLTGPDPCDPNVADCSEGSWADIAYGAIAVSVSGAIAIGIATRVLQRRGANQQQV